MGLFTKDHATEVEALRQRVHPGTVVATCCDCGLRTDCPELTVHERPGTDGQPQPWACCVTCSAFGSKLGLARHVVALVLAASPPDEVLDRVAVPRFCEQPLVRPDRPNLTPWAHLDQRAFAATVAEAHQSVAADTVAPCEWCGTTRRYEERGEFGRAVESRVSCPSCEWHLGRTWHSADGRRDYAASLLLGSRFQQAPMGLGAQMGLRFYWELSPDEQATLPGLRGPWAWVTHREFARTARRLGRRTDRIFRVRW